MRENIGGNVSSSHEHTLVKVLVVDKLRFALLDLCGDEPSKIREKSPSTATAITTLIATYRISCVG